MMMMMMMATSFDLTWLDWLDLSQPCVYDDNPATTFDLTNLIWVWWQSSHFFVPKNFPQLSFAGKTNLLKSSLQFITLLGLRHCTLCTLAQLHKWDMAHNWKLKETPIICCWWEMRMHKRPFPLKLAAATSTQLNKAATSSSWDQNMFC